MRIPTILISLAATAFFAAPAAATTLFAPQYYGPGDMVRTFDVASDGNLTQVGPVAEIGKPLPGAGGIGSIALAPDGNRAIAGFYFTGGAQGLSIGPSGTITAAQSTIGAHRGATVAVTPNGQFAYHAIFSATQGIDAYSMDATGALTALPGSPFASAFPYEAMAISPDGRFLYAGTNAAIHPFAINADGSLTALPIVPLAGPRSLQFSSDGAHLIVSKSSNQLASFNVAADGSLTAAGTPITYGSTEGGFFSIDPNDASCTSPTTTASLWADPHRSTRMQSPPMEPSRLPARCPPNLSGHAQSRYRRVVASSTPVTTAQTNFSSVRLGRMVCWPVSGRPAIGHQAKGSRSCSGPKRRRRHPSSQR